ncbi:MAG: hypothetical protein JXA71_03925 [Chitinispirillaceae bacterium]|nr:hypothetical protein [Chitinispirillaceae bacterium]
MNLQTTGVACLFLIVVPFHSSAQRYLTGELSGIYPADDYVITGNVHVLPRTTLRFEPGSTLRFENFTGIVIRGELICNGTILRPIRFTSSRDLPTSRIMPEAFDWNGIKVTSEAIGISLTNCTICYSTFGLDIGSNATPVALKEVTFFQNGSSSLIRQREMVPVDERVAISYQWPKVIENDDSRALLGKEYEATGLDGKKPSAVATPPGRSRAQRPPVNWEKPVQYATGGLVLAGGVLAAAGHGMAWKYYKDYRREGTTVLRKKGENWIMVRTVGFAVASVGAVGFTLTYIF